MFTNLTPDVTPNGTPLSTGSGIRYFYFKFTAPSTTLGGLGGLVAYICVENNCSSTPFNAGRYTPRVARI